MKRFKSRIFRKSLLTYLVLMFIPAIALGAVFMVQMNASIHEQVQQTNAVSINSLQETASGLFEDIDKVPQRLGNFSPVNSLMALPGGVVEGWVENKDVLSVASLLTLCKIELPIVEEIALVMRNSDMIIDSSGRCSRTDFLGKYHFQTPYFTGFDNIDWSQNQAVLVPGVTMTRYKTDMDVLLYMQVIPQHRQAGACVLIAISTEKLAAALGRVGLPGNTLYALKDSNGAVLVSNDLPQYNAILAAAGTAGDARFGTYTYAGGSYAFTTLVDEAAGMEYTALFSLQAQTQRVQGMLFSGLLLGLAALAAGVLLAFWGASRNYRPLSAIANKFKGTHSGKNEDEYAFIESALSALEKENSHLAQSYLPLMHNRLLRELVSPAGGGEYRSEDYRLCGLSFPHPQYVVGVLRVALLPETGQQARLSVPVRTLAHQLVQQYMNDGPAQRICHLMEDADDKLVLVLNSQPMGRPTCNQLFLGLAAHLESRLAGRHKVAFWLGLSLPVDGPDAAPGLPAGAKGAGKAVLACTGRPALVFARRGL